MCKKNTLVGHFWDTDFAPIRISKSQTIYDTDSDISFDFDCYFLAQHTIYLYFRRQYEYYG